MQYLPTSIDGWFSNYGYDSQVKNSISSQIHRYNKEPIKKQKKPNSKRRSRKTIT